MSAFYREASDVQPTLSEACAALGGFLGSSGALARPLDEIEGEVEERVREIGRRALQEHLDLRAAAERRVRVATHDGEVRSRSRLGKRSVLSVFGRVTMSRLLYQEPGAAALAPQDASLNLPSGLYSHGVRRRVATAVARDSYDETVDRLEREMNVHVPKRQAEEIARTCARDFEEFYVSARTADLEREKDKLLILTFDGAGIVMQPQYLRDVTRKRNLAEANKAWPPKPLTTGKKRNRKRVAQVSAVYGVEPFPRSVEDFLGELRWGAARSVARRPKPINKVLSASVAKSVSEVIANAFDEAERRDPEHKRRWVVLVDGNEQQIAVAEAEARARKVQITILLDVIHVAEYLWKAVNCFFRENEQEERQRWVEERLEMLLRGTDPSRVAAGIGRSATRRKLRTRDAVDRCVAYLCKHREYLWYGEALKAGLPIATGVIEGACRHLVRARLDRSGARWSVEGADAVLQLRALLKNGDLDDYWAFHLKREHERNHAANYEHRIAPNPITTRANLRLIK